MKIYCICKYCAEPSGDDITIEINFSDGNLYYVCPHCKKENKICLEPKPEPLPRIRTQRRY
jgi:hypothetical protein